MPASRFWHQEWLLDKRGKDESLIPRARNDYISYIHSLSRAVHIAMLDGPHEPIFGISKVLFSKTTLGSRTSWEDFIKDVMSRLQLLQTCEVKPHDSTDVGYPKVLWSNQVIANQVEWIESNVQV